MQPDGTLDWTPPRRATWMVLRIGYSLTGHENGPAPAEATGLEVDKLNREYVKNYLDGYLKMYADTVGPDKMGANGISWLLTDSIEVGPQNWTDQHARRVQAAARLRSAALAAGAHRRGHQEHRGHGPIPVGFPAHHRPTARRESLRRDRRRPAQSRDEVLRRGAGISSPLARRRHGDAQQDRRSHGRDVDLGGRAGARMSITSPICAARRRWRTSMGRTSWARSR